MCSALTPVSLLTSLSYYASLLTSLSYYASPAESVPSPEGPIPSFDYWKSKRRKDVHPAASLRYHRESQDLQAQSTGTALSGMYLLLVTSISLIA